MLSHLAMALQIADESSTVPINAYPDYQAGIFNTWFGDDLRTDVNACFKADQALSDDMNSWMQDVQNKDWKALAAISKQMEPLTSADAEPCMTDAQYAAVAADYKKSTDTEARARADPDAKKKLTKIVLAHLSNIQDIVADAFGKWNAGDYYGSGQAYGNLNNIIYKPWMEADEFLQ